MQQQQQQQLMLLLSSSLPSFLAHKTFLLRAALTLALSLVAIAAVFSFLLSPPAPRPVTDMGTLLGGKKPVSTAENTMEFDELGKYAVEQHNSLQNSDLTFVKLLSAHQQVVSGTMYHLMLQAETTGGDIQTYDAKVWVKPWQSWKSLQSFEPVIESPITAADLGVQTDGPAGDGGNEMGLRSVPSDDPVVKEAAQKALEVLQQRSNSLIPYNLKDVISAQAEVKEDTTTFELVLKIGRGDHEEQSKAMLERTVDGIWTVKHSELIT